MADCTALSRMEGALPATPETDLGILPARLSKYLWVTPAEFLQTTNALAIAEWAGRVNPWQDRSLSDPSKRGPKIQYTTASILVMAFIQTAWQMKYEMIVDYFRSHAEAACAAGFVNGRVISIGQYWERRRALGIWPFWLFFLGMVWQLIRSKIIHGVDVVLDSTTQKAWFHGDPDASWSFPKLHLGLQGAYAPVSLVGTAHPVPGHTCQSPRQPPGHPLVGLGNSVLWASNCNCASGCRLFQFCSVPLRSHGLAGWLHN